MSLWYCPTCKALHGPVPGNHCVRCGSALQWSTVNVDRLVPARQEGTGDGESWQQRACRAIEQAIRGRCSGHAQFNGRYCRDATDWTRWCIHCAGFMLLESVAGRLTRTTNTNPIAVKLAELLAAHRDGQCSSDCSDINEPGSCGTCDTLDAGVKALSVPTAPLHARLTGLIAQWRAKSMAAGQFSVDGDVSEEAASEAEAVTLTRCADALDAALRDGTPTP